MYLVLNQRKQRALRARKIPTFDVVVTYDGWGLLTTNGITGNVIAQYLENVFSCVK